MPRGQNVDDLFAVEAVDDTIGAPKDRPEDGEIVLEIDQGGGVGGKVSVKNFISYSFNDNFLAHTESWTFTIADTHITHELDLALRPRRRVQLKINDRIQASGIIDRITTHTSRNGGVEITVEGRGVLSPAVDACIDPRTTFEPGMNLLQFLQKVFAPFGFTDPKQFLIRNDDNINVMSGNNHRSNKKIPEKGKKALANYQIHLLKPETHETAYNFACRVTQRFGLWIWATADGKSIVVDKPSFPVQKTSIITDRQAALQGLDKGGKTTGWESDSTEGRKAIRKQFHSGNNVLTSVAVRDGASQPGVIFATSSSTGGQNPRENYTVAVINPLIQSNLSEVFAAYPKTKSLDLSYLGENFEGDGTTTKIVNRSGLAFVDTGARPLFLTDTNSKSQEELENFLKRELAKRMCKALTYSFETTGHEYTNEDGNKAPWTIDSMVLVDDDYAGIHGEMYIVGRTFTKSRNGGTKTKLDCILPHTLEF